MPGVQGTIKPKSWKVTEVTFPLVKQLIDAGVKGSQIMKTMNISASTLSYIRQTNSLQEYRDLVNEISRRSNARRVKASSNASNATSEKTTEHKQQATKPLAPDFTEVGLELIRDELREIKELLKVIAEGKQPEAKPVEDFDEAEEPKRRSIFSFGQKPF